MASPEAAAVRPLDEGALRANLERLVALDRATADELGSVYDATTWGGAEFELFLPAKFRLSAVAFDGEDVVGFWVASRRPGPTAYAHRVAVRGDHRGRGVGRALFDEAARLALAEGIPALALSVTEGNAAAIAFYERLGFTRLTGDALRRVVTADVGIEDDGYRLASGTRKLVYGRSLTRGTT